MAIFHVRMAGIVDDEIEIIRDENGNSICCVFTMLVKEKGGEIPFSVYIDDNELVEKCENELITGSAILVSGIIEIEFLDTKELYPSISRSVPIIKSNMTIISNELCIAYGRREKEHSTYFQRRIHVETEKSEPGINILFDVNDELPF